MKNSELLLPVGNMQMCLAAIHNGADAIYVGAPIFNARGRTDDLSYDQLQEIIDLCHLYGVQVHIAFNILIFENEMEQAREVLDGLVAIGPDALIIQDLGLVKMAREIYPQLIIHGSTQMTVTNHLSIEFLEDLNIQRFVLGRENSLKEIELIKNKTSRELEVFVHGALCVAYSGQCFTSEGIGGRSANRGKCAQSCRFSYEMFVDEQKIDLKGRDYIVSPKDLCGINEVSQLQKIGVESFKVEGRLKKPSYVASVARSYKAVMLDEPGAVKERIDEMAQTYSRGFFSGWMHGVDHQKLVHGEYGDNRGSVIGKVQAVNQHSILISSDHELIAGQGLLFSKDAAGKIYQVEKIKNQYSLQMGRDFPYGKVIVGDEVFLNSSPQLMKELEKSFSDFSLMKRIPVSMRLRMNIGEYPTLFIDDGEREIKVHGTEDLEAAKNPLNKEIITKELQSLSRTAYDCKKVVFEFTSEDPFISQKVVKKLRQQAIEKLNKKRITFPKLKKLTFEVAKASSVNKADHAVLNILLRERIQVDQLIDCLDQNQDLLPFLGLVYLDFEFGQHFKPSVEKLKASGFKVALCTNRILKPGDYTHLKTLVSLAPEAIVARNLGAVQFLQEMAPNVKIIGDFSLNVTNSIAAQYLSDKGIEQLTVSYDLNQQHLFNLVKKSPHIAYEITVHHYMPSFHMEHCVYATFLSEGSSIEDCGKPCKKHKVRLKDQFGNTHFIKADQECRNTMFNGTAQSSSGLVERLKNLGVGQFRLELLFEQDDELSKKVLSYLRLVKGEISSEQLVKDIHILEKYGFSSSKG